MGSWELWFCGLAIVLEGIGAKVPMQRKKFSGTKLCDPRFIKEVAGPTFEALLPQASWGLWRSPNMHADLQTHCPHGREVFLSRYKPDRCGALRHLQRSGSVILLHESSSLYRMMPLVTCTSCVGLSGLQEGLF